MIKYNKYYVKAIWYKEKIIKENKIRVQIMVSQLILPLMQKVKGRKDLQIVKRYHQYICLLSLVMTQMIF